MAETVKISEKYMLSVEEAAQYFRLGEKRIRQLAREWPNETFYLMNGNRLLIKRVQMEHFLDKMEQV